MARGRVKISWIEDQKARKSAYKTRMQGLIKKTEELTILCSVEGCLVLYNPDDKKVMTWPSHEEAKFLLDKFFSLPPHERNAKTLNQESYIIENTHKLEKKLMETRKVNMEYEMKDLMFQLQEGRAVDDLHETEVDKLLTYAYNKVMILRRELGYRKHCNPINKPSSLNPRPSDVESDLGGGSFYYIDRWLPLNETHLPQMVSSFNLNMEEDATTKKWYPGECSNSRGVDDDA